MPIPSTHTYTYPRVEGQGIQNVEFFWGGAGSDVSEFRIGESLDSCCKQGKALADGTMLDRTKRRFLQDDKQESRAGAIEDGRLLPQTKPHPIRDETADRMGHQVCCLVVRRYQTRQLLAGVMGLLALHEKAGPKPGWLTMGPSTRNWSGECSLVRVWVRSDSGRSLEHQFWAKAI
jgi:hypothetical protein